GARNQVVSCQLSVVSCAVCCRLRLRAHPLSGAGSAKPQAASSQLTTDNGQLTTDNTMTSRAWWFFLFVLLVLAFGLLGDLAALSVLVLALLLWFLGEWFLFRLRSRFIVRRVLLEREVRHGRGPVDSLWAGRVFEVRVRLRLPSLLGLPYVAVTDWVPLGLEL